MENKSTNKKAILLYSLIIIYIALITATLLFIMGITHSYTLDYEHRVTKFIYLELCIIFAAMFVLILLTKKWIQRQNENLKMLIFVLLADIITLAASVFKKIVHYFIEEQVIPKDTYIYSIIYNFRISLIFGAITGLLMYEFYLKVFQSENNRPGYRKFLIVFTILVIILQLIPAQNQENETRLIVGAAAYIQMFLTYVPLTFDTFKLQRGYLKKTNLNGKEEKKVLYGIRFMFLMSLSFLLIGIAFVASMIYDMVTDTSYGPFYLIQTGFTILTLIFFYMGFEMPKWFLKVTKISQ